MNEQAAENPGEPITKKLTDGTWHKRLRDFESFDEIRLRVVPRYKTSGLSGDEWRQHVQIDFYFKGERVHETGFRDMQAAIMFLGSEWIKAQEPIPMRVIEIEKAKCDQPSCAEDAVVKYVIKRQTSERGDWLDPAEQHGMRFFRQFCKRHAQRGDCGREDADRNYEPLEGSAGPEVSTNLEESPSQFGGVVAMEAIATKIEEMRATADPAVPGTTTTLVAALKTKPQSRNRDELIKLCEAGSFHDFRSERATPKRDLVALLQAAGFDDLAKATIGGEYDDPLG